MTHDNYKYRLLKERTDNGEKPEVYVLTSMSENGYDWYTVTKDYCTSVSADEDDLFAYCTFNFEVNMSALFLHREAATQQVTLEINKNLDKEA